MILFPSFNSEILFNLYHLKNEDIIIHMYFQKRPRSLTTDALDNKTIEIDLICADGYHYISCPYLTYSR
jgi:hypothetical protein